MKLNHQQGCNEVHASCIYYYKQEGPRTCINPELVTNKTYVQIIFLIKQSFNYNNN